MTKINDLSTIDTLTANDKLIVWNGATRAITATNARLYFSPVLQAGIPEATQTEITDVANPVNTDDKFDGKLIWNLTYKNMLRASGDNPADVWERVSGNQFDSPFYIVKTLGDLTNNYFATDLNRSTSPNTQHYQIYTMRGPDLQQTASQNFVRWLFREDGKSAGGAYGNGLVAHRMDYTLRGESNNGFMVAQNINMASYNLTGATSMALWTTSMSPPSATLAATYGLPGVTYGWTGGIVHAGEFNFGNRFSDFGILENVTSGRCVFGLFLVPDITDTEDGITVSEIVASGEIYPAQFGLVVSKSSRGHKVYAPIHIAYDTIGPSGYGLLINGNQSSAVDQGSLVMKAQGYFDAGIDFSGCTFSETYAIRIPVGKRIRYSGSQYIGMTGTENGIFNGTASIKAEQNARVILTSPTDVVIIANLDIRNNIINSTNDVLMTTEGAVRFPSYTTAQLEDITNAINTSPNKVAGFTVFNSTLGLLCTATGSNDNSPWSRSDNGTDLTPT